MTQTTHEEKQFIKMTQAPVGRLIASLAVPTVLTMFVTAIYNITDTFFVAHLGASATGAVGVVFSLMSLIQALGMGIGMGSSSLISRSLGKRNTKEASMFLSSAFLAALLMGLFICVCGEYFITPLMKALGSTDTILPYSKAYSKYILLAAPIMCSAFVLNTTLRAEGKTFLSMIGIISGSLLNIALAPLFIFTFKMGITGASIAIFLCQSVSFLVLLSFFITGKSICHLSYKNISFHYHDYWQIIHTGFPTIVRQGCACIAMSLLNIQSAQFGDAAVAGISIASKIYIALRSLVNGIGQALQPVAGYNYGAKIYKRVHQAFWVSTGFSSIVCILIALFLFIFDKQIIEWFGTNDLQVILIGSVALRYLSISLPFLPYSTYVNQLLQTTGHSKSASFLASCRQGIIFIPLVLVLPYFLSITGIQLTQPLADIFTTLISIPFLKRFFNKYPPAKED